MNEAILQLSASPALIALSIALFISYSITTFDKRLIQAKRIGDRPSNIHRLPSWVIVFHILDWVIMITMLIVNWKVALLVWVCFFVLKVLPVFETIGNVLMAPFKPQAFDHGKAQDEWFGEPSRELNLNQNIKATQHGKSQIVTECTGINDLIERGDMDGINRALAKNPELASAQESDRWGYTPLHNAVARHNTQLVKFLLDFGVDVNIEARSGETPLVTAAGEADADICLLLIEKGAHPFGTTEDGETALHFAAMENLPEVATRLLSIGAKRVAVNKKGETPLDWARQYNNRHVERVLRN